MQDPDVLRRLLRAKDRIDAASHEPASARRYGTVDAGFRDPPGNGWKIIQARR